MKIPEHVPKPLSGWTSDVKQGVQNTSRLSLSLVIITLNEEKNIERCIKSVPFASEVIIVDSFSRDRTVEIAARLGAKVLVREFMGYREQKQFALSLATQEWVLSLDADEALSVELQYEIPVLLSRADVDGFRIPRCSFHLDRWIRHGGWYPDYQNRLFRRKSGSWTGGEVHEHIQILGRIETLTHDLHHYVFTDFTDQIDTNNEFSTLGAVELQKRGEKFSALKIVFRPLGKFLECYVWKKGFLDGVPGFVIALGAAQSLFFKYAKLWELELPAPSSGHVDPDHL